MARVVRSFQGLARLSSSTSQQQQKYKFCVPLTQTSQSIISGKWRLYQSSSASEEGNNEKSRVVFLGTPDVAATTLRKLYEESTKDDSCFDIVGVVTQPPKRRKRKGKAEQSPVGKVAEEYDLNLLYPEKVRLMSLLLFIVENWEGPYGSRFLTCLTTFLSKRFPCFHFILKANNSEFLDDLQNNVRPDLCITAAYGQYLPKRFLATPTYGTVNIHPSLLPRWRGASPVQRSLEAGDNPVGVTVLFTVSKMDAGPIVNQQEHTLEGDETATTLLPYLFEVGTDLLIDSMPDLLNGKITMETAEEQNEDNIVDAAMISPAEAEMKPWEESATTLHNKARGFSMWPGTYLMFEVGEDSEPTKFKILETRVLEDEKSDNPNSDAVVPGPSKKDGLRVTCFDGSILEINRLQPATRKPMDALSFINGLQGKTVRWVKPSSTD